MCCPDTVEEDVLPEIQQASPAVQTNSAAPTRLLEDTETRPPAESSVLLTQMLLESSEPEHTGNCTLVFFQIKLNIILFSYVYKPNCREASINITCLCIQITESIVFYL